MKNTPKTKTQLMEELKKLHQRIPELGKLESERKLAEEELKETLEDLERSNKELEQFAYVALHDLQKPLRAVARQN
ncbi:hypothetical protein LCGC14_1082130 [marine sediment metagenome]|uniref:Uncharacterized protein n=1 Tax=marine sediment metagenome TaxID=412755 RepID=A0A0F9QKU5_9ZZZZ|nr:hypothetical protein [Candidatus Aminicenantes bacterium]HEB34772.1 hypothetical protein [Candidatus Aminicenantes bacterium]